MRQALALLLIFLWLCWCCVIFWQANKRKPRPQCNARLLVAYASQGGTAAALAAEKAKALSASAAVNLLPLDKVCQRVLSSTERAFFIVSTYGQGEPPDNGRRFQRDILTARAKDPLDLSHLSYSVIALGDRQYPDFCAFGHTLNKRLSLLGAVAEQPVTEIDSQTDTAALSSQLTPWQLNNRVRLNPKDTKAPLYEVSLTCKGRMPHWQAGDILVIRPRISSGQLSNWLQLQGLDGQTPVTINDNTTTLIEALSERRLPEKLPENAQTDTSWIQRLAYLPQREYSIASAPQKQQLKLIVRRVYQAPQTPGLGSGWLTQFSEPGDITHASIRSNPACHITDHRRPMLLIGAGSGLAGIRGHIAQRIASKNNGPVWVIYGERAPRQEMPLAEDFSQWLQQGHIETLDYACSATPEKTYVQDLLSRQQSKLKTFVHQGADIYLCGNKKGMGDAVHQVLLDVLSIENVTALMENGRYHRDLY